MKIVVISDIHGNYDALLNFPEDYDQLWVLGDLVNYGPQPGEVISLVQNRATYVARGNHDHFVGFGEPPRCAPQFQEMAEATWKYTDGVLTEGDKEYLRSRPLQVDVWVGKIHCRLCHGIPTNPPFRQHPSADRDWDDECRRVSADILFYGGGHVAAGRKSRSTLLVNPGSLGQSRCGEPVASYAVLKDGKVSLRSFHYPVGLTAEKVRALPISASIRSELINLLRTGVVRQDSTPAVTVGRMLHQAR